MRAALSPPPADPPPIRSTEQIEQEHAVAWRAWLATLTPDEQVALERAGLGAPPKPGRRRQRRAPDQADADPTIGTCDGLTSADSISGERQLDPAEALMAAEEGVDDGLRRELALLAHVLPVIVDAENPRLEASLVALALRIGVRQGITLDRLRQRHGHGLRWLAAQVRGWERKFDVCRASLALLRVVISPILSSRNPRLEAECIALAARFGLSGGASMTARGEHHGVCKAAVSARVGKWVRDFGLVKPRTCKLQTANYEFFNVRREKPKPIVAP